MQSWQNAGLSIDNVFWITGGLAVKSFLVKVALVLFGGLPLKLARALGAGVARLAWLCDTRMAKITQQNIAYCMPEMPLEEQRVLAKNSVLETGRLALETAVVWGHSPAWTQHRIVAVHHAELVKEALASGQGVLILAPHIGNWEVLNIYLASIGKMTNMYQPPKIAGLEAVVRRCRENSGAITVPTDRKGLLAILTALKQGGISGILPDQTPKDEGSGLFAPFFARHAFTMTLAHKLISKSQCKPVFAYAARVDKGFEITFFEPHSDLTGNDEQLACNALSRGIEQCVRAIPAQYQWEYKRFKKRLPDEPNPY